MIRSLTEPSEADEDEVDALLEVEPSAVDEGDFLLAKSSAIRMAKYLHKCSTSALDVVLMYLVALSFMASMTSFCSISANISGCNLKTISTSCAEDPELPDSSAFSSFIDEFKEVGGLIFFFFLGGGIGASS